MPEITTTYGKAFEAYELLINIPVKKVIEDAFYMSNELDMLKRMKRTHKRWSDFYYALDDYHKSLFAYYLEGLVK